MEENAVAQNVEQSKPARPQIAVSDIEQMVNVQAETLARKMKLGNCKFRIFLPLGDQAAAVMERGTTVNIYITGHDIISPIFWQVVRDCLKQVPKLQERTDLVPSNKLYRKMQGGRWTAVTFKDKSEVLPILSRDRVKFTVSTTVTATDKVSGLSASVTSENGKVVQMENAAISQLSREVWNWEIDAEKED